MDERHQKLIRNLCPRSSVDDVSIYPRLSDQLNDILYHRRNIVESLHILECKAQTFR